MRDNVRSVGIDLSLRLVAPRSGPAAGAPVDGRSWVGDVRVSWRVRGAGPGFAHAEVPLTFRDVRGGAAFVTARSAADAVPLWLLERAARRACGGDGRHGLRRRGPRAGSRASPYGRWPTCARCCRGWPGVLVVEVPRSRAAADPGARVAAGRLHGDRGGDHDGRRVAAADRSRARLRQPAGLRPAWATRGSQIVISHEATHVAVGAALSTMPPWLLEGFADYVALAHVDLPVARAAQPDPRPGPPPTGPRPVFPDRLRSTPAAPTLGASYESAWLACRLLAEKYGEHAADRVLPGRGPIGDDRRAVPHGAGHRPAQRSPAPGGRTCCGGPADGVDPGGRLGRVTDSGRGRLARRPAVLTVLVSATLLVRPGAPCWCRGTWVPGGHLVPRSAASLFTPAELARAERFSWTRRGLGWAAYFLPLAVLALLGFTDRGSRLLRRVAPRRRWWLAVPAGTLVLLLVARAVALPFAARGAPGRPRLRPQPPGVGRLVGRPAHGAGRVLGRHVAGPAGAGRAWPGAHHAGGSPGREPPRCCSPRPGPSSTRSSWSRCSTGSRRWRPGPFRPRCCGWRTGRACPSTTCWSPTPPGVRRPSTPTSPGSASTRRVVVYDNLLAEPVPGRGPGGRRPRAGARQERRRAGRHRPGAPSVRSGAVALLALLLDGEPAAPTVGHRGRGRPGGAGTGARAHRRRGPAGQPGPEHRQPRHRGARRPRVDRRRPAPTPTFVAHAAAAGARRAGRPVAAVAEPALVRQPPDRAAASRPARVADDVPQR